MDRSTGLSVGLGEPDEVVRVGTVERFLRSPPLRVSDPSNLAFIQAGGDQGAAINFRSGLRLRACRNAGRT